MNDMERPNRDQIEKDLIEANQMYYGSTIENIYHQRLEAYVSYLEQKLNLPGIMQGWRSMVMNKIEENIGVAKIHLDYAKAEKNKMEKTYRMGYIHALQDLRFEILSSHPTVANEG